MSPVMVRAKPARRSASISAGVPGWFGGTAARTVSPISVMRLAMAALLLSSPAATIRRTIARNLSAMRAQAHVSLSTSCGSPRISPFSLILSAHPSIISACRSWPNVLSWVSVILSSAFSRSV